MMRYDSFVRGVLFAALAAIFWLPCALLLGPLVGLWNALSLYLVTVTCLYAAEIVPPGAPRFRVAALTGVAALAIAVIASRSSELTLGLAAILGIARSGFLYRGAPVRALFTEMVLLGGGLLFARFLGGPGLLSASFALWGFFLVQSFFFLFGGVGARGPQTRPSDRFDEAHRRAIALLES
jgi:hypothetical protein